MGDDWVRSCCSRRTAQRAVLVVVILVAGTAVVFAQGSAPAPDDIPLSTVQGPVPRWYTDRAEHTIACDNGILRIRPTELGIIWFDVYHPRDKRWYLNKNNLNLMTLVPGSGWQNTELDHVQPKVEVVSSDDDQLVLRYHFEFPHGAKIYTDVFLERGQPSVRFVLHRTPGSSEITGFQWHVTFGQAEAVSTLRFDNQKITVEQLPRPFPGGREEVQHVRWFRDLKGLDFSFSGEETSAPDPSNPKWMTRVLGLKQHVTWGKPMRAQDRFAFEARDQPWQPDWGVPKARPWIEGLWFVRNGEFPEGDELTFGIDNLTGIGTRSEMASATGAEPAEVAYLEGSTTAATAAVFAQGRSPVPDDAAQAKARDLVHEIYGPQYDEAKTSTEKSALARKMLNQAAKTKGDPVSYFVLLRIARDMAIQAGDPHTSLEAVDQIARTYQVEAIAMKVQTLLQTAANARLPEQRKAVVQAALPLIRAAVVDDDYASANRLARKALDLARRARDAALLKQMVAINKDVTESGQAYAEVRKARDALEDNPTDAEANLAVGRHLCLVKGDWDRGISMLALGNDAELRALAVKELAGATSADAAVALGDGWWELASKSEGREKVSLMVRAGSWYREGQAAVTSGLARIKVQKRLDEIAKAGHVIPRISVEPPPAIPPFNAAKAKEHQQAWAKYLGLPVEQEVDLSKEAKLTMVLIPPGEFLMGSTPEEQARLLEKAEAAEHERIPSEGPQHRVTITKPFRLSTHEVTRGQFRRFVEETGYKTEAEQDGQGGFGLLDGQWRQDPRFVWSADPGFPQTDDHPVAHVSWNDARAFCQWLSKKQGLKYALPTEAQWEYACRAGTMTLWHCGDGKTTLQECAWFSVNAGGKAHPVGQLKPNAWGLYDVHGNVSEWLADWYGADYYAQSPPNDPHGPSAGSLRVRRGGCWYSHAGWCRSAFRHNSPPGFRTHILGFRLASVLADE